MEDLCKAVGFLEMGGMEEQEVEMREQEGL